MYACLRDLGSHDVTSDTRTPKPRVCGRRARSRHLLLRLAAHRVTSAPTTPLPPLLVRRSANEAMKPSSPSPHRRLINLHNLTTPKNRLVDAGRLSPHAGLSPRFTQSTPPQLVVVSRLYPSWLLDTQMYAHRLPLFRMVWPDASHPLMGRPSASCSSPAPVGHTAAGQRG